MASTTVSTTVIIMAKKTRAKSKALSTIVAVLVIAVIVLFVILGISLLKNRELSSGNKHTDNTEELNETTDEVTDNTVKTIVHSSDYTILPNEEGIPIAQIDVDINEVKSVNEDVCGWIYIPDTNVNCAIVCNSDNPDYYLTNDINNINGVFIQNYNSNDFSDRMTVVYGKSQNGKSQFDDLLKYKDKTFFDNHRYIYVKQDNKILTYKIFAARKAYAEHLMLGYDWSVDQVFLDYLIYIIKSGDIEMQSEVETALDIDENANIDNTLDVDVNDRVITLSQRIEGEDNYRYLVQGVLINESIEEAP